MQEDNILNSPIGKNDMQNQLTPFSKTIKKKQSLYSSDSGCRFQNYPNCQEECKIQRILTVSQSKIEFALEIFLSIISCGISYFIFQKHPLLRLKLLMKRVDPTDSNQVLIQGPDKVREFKKYLSKKQIKDDLKVFEYRFQRFVLQENNQFLPFFDNPYSMSNSQIILYSKWEEYSEDFIQKSNQRNGMNKTDINDRGLTYLLIKELLSPFYYFQAGSVLLWFYEEYLIYAYVIIITAILGFLAKIHSERLNFLKLKKFTFLRKQTIVFRNGLRKEITSDQVIFGDIVLINKGEIAICDLVIIQGSAIVSESSLTGDCIPNSKTELPNNDDYFIDNKLHIIYSGSLILSTQNLKCKAISIGFETLRGKMIRSIIFPRKQQQISFQADTFYLICILVLNALISFFTSLPTFITKLEQELVAQEDVIIRCLDLLTISIPPALPLCLSFGLTISLNRLSRQQLFCLNSSNINICGILQTICFDKTGTLTENLVCYFMVSSFEIEGKNANQFVDCIGENNIKQLGILQRVILGSCHSLKRVKGIIQGDPLDLEMFKKSGYNITKKTQFQLQAEGRGAIQEIIGENDNENIEVLKCFPFDPKYDRLSCIVRFKCKVYLLTKGAPEKLKKLLLPESLPQETKGIESYEGKLRSLTQQGYRVLSFGYKEINSQDIGLQRKKLEFNVKFGGFIVFENKLKKGTDKHIEFLIQSKIKVMMVTGDNAQTAVNVANQCKILSQNSISPILDYQSNQIIFEKEGNQSVYQNIEEILEYSKNRKIEFVVTGNFFERFFVDNQDKQQLSTLLNTTKVFARMNQNQKQSLVSQIQNSLDLSRKTFVGVCGDGSNDISALKCADMGISLGSGEASIAAGFTSKLANIGIIGNLLREGRSCITTMFTCFKFMALYSMIQVETTGIIYYRGVTPSNYQFLYWDLCLVLPLSFLIGLTCASSTINEQLPPHRLFSLSIVLSVIGNGIIQFVFLLLSIIISATQSWYIDPISYQKQSGLDQSEVLMNSFDNTVLFWMSNFQYVSVVVAFSIFSIHKKPFYTNICLSVYVLLVSAMNLFLLFTTNEEINEFFEIYPQLTSIEDETLISEMSYSWRFFILGFSLINMLVTFAYELFFLKKISKYIEEKYVSFIRMKTKTPNKDSLSEMYELNSLKLTTLRIQSES